RYALVCSFDGPIQATYHYFNKKFIIKPTNSSFMKHKHLLISLLMLLLLIAGITDPVRAQGVTSATMGGIVIDSNGEELPGATIIAVHNPSGTNYGTASRVDGRFTIPGMHSNYSC